MNPEFSKTKAVCFDLGNTLIEFGPRQIAMQYERLTAKLVEMFGSCDAAKLKEIRDRQIVAPYPSQGAKGMGMKSILTTEHLPYERFEPKAGDHQPDARIAHIDELQA